MRTLDQITDILHGKSAWDVKRRILQEWAEEIIEECANSATDWYESPLSIDKESILKVKEKL